VQLILRFRVKFTFQIPMFIKIFLESIKYSIILFLCFLFIQNKKWKNIKSITPISAPILDYICAKIEKAIVFITHIRHWPSRLLQWENPE